jgi:hypothetical protein
MKVLPADYLSQKVTWDTHTRDPDPLPEEKKHKHHMLPNDPTISYVEKRSHSILDVPPHQGVNVCTYLDL